jgi:Cof subfamily protein (haloacid dehalogenase superfamily)
MKPARAKTRHDIRMVAVDLDGTLLDDQKRISAPSAKALTGLSRGGVKVVLASARPPRSVRAIHAALKLDTWQINYNGALVWDEKAGKAISHHPIPGHTVRQIIEHARRLHPEVMVSCELLDRWYTDRQEDDYHTETGRMFRPDVIAPLKDFIDVSMTKILLSGDPDAMTQMELSLGMAFDEDIAIVRTEADLIQVMNKLVSKASALRLVAHHYKVPMANILAIGDAPNDLEMLRASGAAVAMENGHRAVKEVAHWIAPSNNNHGVHAALVRYGLCK